MTWALRVLPCLVIRQYFRKRFMYTLARRGLMTPPCGVPRLLFRPPVIRRFPLSSRSSTGTLSHILIRRSTSRSTILRATDCLSSRCGMVSKEDTTHYPPPGSSAPGQHRPRTPPPGGSVSRCHGFYPPRREPPPYSRPARRKHVPRPRGLDRP